MRPEKARYAPEPRDHCKQRVCIVTTTPYVPNVFLRRHLAALAEQYDVTLAVNTNDRYPLHPELADRLDVVHIAIERNISPLRDLRALSQLTVILRRRSFMAVHTIAPKAGLLGIAAAFIARIPVRIHTFQGEVWASRHGLARHLLRGADWLVSRLATHVLVVGRGEQEFLEREGVLVPGRSTVIGHGSVCGVDGERFRPDASARRQIRDELNISGENQFVAMYVGRLARDKGVLDLARAFRRFHAKVPEAWLVFVGADEEGLRSAIERACEEAAAALRFIPFIDRPERYMAAADVVCLPSYREGFPITLLEAGACGVSVIASRIYGTRDAVVEGVTGLFHEPADVEQIERCLMMLARGQHLRTRLGNAGRERVLKDFRPDALVSAFLEYYRNALARPAVVRSRSTPPS